MTIPPWFGKRRRWLCVVALLAIGGMVGLPHARAWYHYRAGEAALEPHADAALGHLNACLRLARKWAGTPAGGACRTSAPTFAAAARHLEIAQEHLGSSEDILLEWALQQAPAGNHAAVEPYLESRLRDGFLPDGPLIFEARVVG